MAFSLKNRLCHPSRQDWKALGLALLICSISLGLALSTSHAPPFKTFKGFWKEILVYVVMLAAISQSRRFRVVFLGMGRLRMFFMASIVGLVFWGQLLRNSDLTYPFVLWPMHTSSTNKSTAGFVDYQVTYADGQKGPFPFKELGITEIVHNYTRRIAMELERNSEEEENNGSMDRLVRVYNGKYPANPITGFRIYRCIVPLKNYSGPESVKRTLILEKSLNE